MSARTTERAVEQVFEHRGELRVHGLGELMSLLPRRNRFKREAVEQAVRQARNKGLIRIRTDEFGVTHIRWRQAH